eukprot:2850347-Rhodomonas_salina.1
MVLPGMSSPTPLGQKMFEDLRKAGTTQPMPAIMLRAPPYILGYDLMHFPVLVYGMLLRVHAMRCQPTNMGSATTLLSDTDLRYDATACLRAVRY